MGTRARISSCCRYLLQTTSRHWAPNPAPFRIAALSYEASLYRLHSTTTLDHSFAVELSTCFTVYIRNHDFLCPRDWCAQVCSLAHMDGLPAPF